MTHFALNRYIKRTHLNLSAGCWDLCCPMRVIDEFAGSVVGGETNNMLEWDVVHEVLFIEAFFWFAEEHKWGWKYKYVKVRCTKCDKGAFTNTLPLESAASADHFDFSWKKN